MYKHIMLPVEGDELSSKAVNECFTLAKAIGAKVTVLRGTRVGRGCVLGAHAVVRGDFPDYKIAVGAPARVVRDRRADYEADAQRRADIADMARKAKEALEKSLENQG